MATITMLVGPPGSGKSTMARDLIENDGDHGAATVRISQDDQGRVGHMELFERAIAEGQNIIVDRMNYNKDQRNRYLEPARKAGYNVRIIVVHTPFQVCMARCNARVGHPTIQDEKTASKAINFFFSNYERVEDSEADRVDRLGWVGDKGFSAVICDLDGTLCNIEHRRHFVRPTDGTKKNWPAFFAGIPNDTINEWCKELLIQMSASHKIVFCSGRGENERMATVEWLEKNKVQSFYDPLFETETYADLFMRNRQDSRQDSIVKEIILDFEILTRYKPIFMIDDRQQVVDMWRRRGFVCLQCDVGDF